MSKIFVDTIEPKTTGGSITFPESSTFSGTSTFNGTSNFTGTVTGASPTVIVSSGNAGSAVSNLEIDLPTDASYHKFELSIHDIYNSGDTDLAVAFRTSGGSYATNYTYSTMERTYGASPNGASGNSGSGNAQIGYYNLGNALIEANSYNITITNNKTASYHTKYFYTAYGLASNAYATIRVGGGSVNVAEINDRLKLYPLSGTMTHGEWVLYGWKK
ncbi:MAG: hypothetical protein CMI75_08495 [Candidatus Pelagibacter sp.]|nr:hypothetical protein [Candidatus Pelagibacter sp.]|tara:strand:- start:696 stop:1346 length:651 start_codon:yes stop_codon:yes gene_type:complete